MGDISPDTIICKFDDQGGQWLAHCEQSPQVAFGSDMPVRAIRRLLEGIEADPDVIILMCDRDLAGTRVLRRKIIWDPPELLFPCGTCEVRGEYVGLLERDICRTCGGRKVVPV